MDTQQKETELTLDFQPVGRNGSVTIAAKIGEDVLAVEKLDLAKPKQRTAFAERLVEACPAIDTEEVESLLLQEAAKLTKPKETDDDQPEPDRLASMPEAVKREASALLESPELLQRIVTDISRLGVAGERELTATAYLIGTSRLLGKPLGGNRARPVFFREVLRHVIEGG